MPGDAQSPGAVQYLEIISAGLSLDTIVHKNAFITSKLKEYSIFFCTFPKHSCAFY